MLKDKMDRNIMARSPSSAVVSKVRAQVTLEGPDDAQVTRYLISWQNLRIPLGISMYHL
jgi:hypothetical protein